jgi:hypothetical protein
MEPVVLPTVAAAPKENPLVDCLLRGGHPNELLSLLKNTPGIANSTDAQGPPVGKKRWSAGPPPNFYS